MIDRITKGNRIQDDKNRIEAPSPMEFNVTDEEDEVGQALNDVHSTPIGNKNCPKSLGPVYYAKKYWLIFGIISHVLG